MLMKAFVKQLRARWKHTVAALVLVPVPVFAMALLGSWNFSRSASDPSVDVALLVEPSVLAASQPLPEARAEQIDTLLNWKYTPITTGS
jgi:hypothetical protein